MDSFRNGFRSCHGIIMVNALIFFLFWGCSDPSPIQIGFVGGLTGRVADLGIAGRDGAILAVEQINAEGGILGRPINLMIKDDRQDPATATRVVRELIDLKVDAIIGHMTSVMSLVGAPLADQAQITMISPTTSTNDLSHKKDFFFRVYPASEDAAATLANHAFTRRKYTRINVLYDIRNRAHTEGWYKNFKKEFTNLGGKIPLALTYTSGMDVNFLSLARQLTTAPSDALFILANAMDTAMICQQLAKIKTRLPVLTSEWSATEDILKFGGSSVEGMEFLHTFDKQNTSPGFIAFNQAFKKRFGYAPGFASAHAYDCVQVLKTAMTHAKVPERIRQSILDIGVFEGLQGRLYFDAHGDILRDYHPMTIEKGQFKRLPL